jgi:hypothetical protein
MNKQVTSNKSGPQNKQNAGGKQSKPVSNAQNRQASRQSNKQGFQKQQKQDRLRKQQQAARNKGIAIGAIIAAVALVIIGIGYYVYMTNHAQVASATETVVDPNYPPVDGVYCDSLEQTAYHYHALLAMYINGQAVSLPSQIGITSDCYYWLHTHDTSGVIHIESPNNHTYTLGNLLDEWSQHFSSLGFYSQLNSPNWDVWINGKVYTGDLHNIVLKPHEIITLAYNSPGVKPVTTYDWNGL